MAGHALAARTHPMGRMITAATALLLIASTLVQSYFCAPGDRLIRSDSDDSIVVKNATRTVDLRGRVVHIIYQIKVINSGPHRIHHLRIPNPVGKSDGFSISSAHSQSSPNEPSLRVCSNARDDSQLVLLEPPVEAEGTAIYNIRMHVTDAVEPHPMAVTMHDSQFVMLEISERIHLGYPVNKQSTKFILSDGISSFEPIDRLQKTSRNGLSTIDATGTPPNDPGPTLRLRYPLDIDLGVFDKVIREFVVQDHKIKVHEYFDFRNNAVRLIGDFDRNIISSMTGQIFAGIRSGKPIEQKHFAISLLAQLPPDAYSIGYYDRIGNISTSNAWREGNQLTKMLVEPRYPVLGGWLAEWFIDYDLPLSSTVTTNNSTTRRGVAINFSIPFIRIPAKEVVVRIILPAGATDVAVDAPVETSEVITKRSWQQLEMFLPSTMVEFTIKNQFTSAKTWNVKLNVYYTRSRFYDLQKLFSCLLAVSIPLALYFLRKIPFKIETVAEFQQREKVNLRMRQQRLFISTASDLLSLSRNTLCKVHCFLDEPTGDAQQRFGVIEDQYIMSIRTCMGRIDMLQACEWIDFTESMKILDGVNDAIVSMFTSLKAPSNQRSVSAEREIAKADDVVERTESELRIYFVKQHYN